LKLFGSTVCNYVSRLVAGCVVMFYASVVMTWPSSSGNTVMMVMKLLLNTFWTPSLARYCLCWREVVWECHLPSVCCCCTMYNEHVWLLSAEFRPSCLSFICCAAPLIILHSTYLFLTLLYRSTLIPEAFLFWPVHVCMHVLIHDHILEVC